MSSARGAVRVVVRGMLCGAACSAAWAITACGHETQAEPAAVTPSRPQESPPDAGADASTGGVPQAFRGPFHLPGRVDAINLVLEDDGKFRWRIFGCDFAGGGEGVWKSSGAEVVLLPAAGAASFSWMDDVSFKHAASKVTLKARAGGGLDARAAAGSDVWSQSWEAGRVCAQCGGGLGPDKMPRPCNQPIPAAGAPLEE